MATIHIYNNKQESEVTESKVQYMPFRLHADCDAKVSDYFDTNVRTNEDSIQSASFRGRLLLGKQISLPENYKGVILHETVKPTTDKQERKFYVTHRFSSFTNWNWDKIPSKNDAILQALAEWVDVAETLHAPIVE